MPIVELGFFPTKFAVGALLLRTDEDILYVNRGTFAIPSFEVLADPDEPGIFVGTGAQIAGLSPVPGQTAFCTSTGSGFISGHRYGRNDGNTAWIDAGVLPESQIYFYNVTIGDYSQPSAAVRATATSINNDYTQTTNDADRLIGAGVTYSRVATKVINGPSIGQFLYKITYRLRKVGSPTGTITFLHRKADDTIKQTLGTKDITTVAGTDTDYEFIPGGAPQLIEDNDRFTAEYSGGDGSNHLAVRGTISSVETDHQVSRYDSGWLELTNNDMYFKYSAYTDTKDNAVDDDTGTDWISLQIANNEIDIDHGSAVEMTGIAIYLDAATTETEIEIYTSIDDSTYTLRRTILVSKLTTGAWNFIRLPRETADFRYYRIRGSSGSSLILAISELKEIAVATAIIDRGHGHLVIDPAETGTNLDAT